MRLIHIVGRRNHGKTTLIVDLVEEYARRGIAVGTIKHSSHAHELDTPGKDSYRHRQAGAAAAAVITAELLGVWLPRRAGADPYAAVAPCSRLVAWYSSRGTWMPRDSRSRSGDKPSAVHAWPQPIAAFTQS